MHHFSFSVIFYTYTPSSRRFIMQTSPLIAIIGRSRDTKNYERALTLAGAKAITTLKPEEYLYCDGLLLPGGGDITPAFFGQSNQGSRQIDTELDIIQLLALTHFIQQKKPILGICKGLQIINTHFGGTIIQHLPTADKHQWNGADRTHYVYHIGCNRMDFFYQLYGTSALVNSAHHQAVDKTGEGLLPVCKAGDGTIEAIVHTKLPIMAVQWHPERMLDMGGMDLISYFLNNSSFAF